MIKFFIAPPAKEGVTLTFERKTPGSVGWDLHANMVNPYNLAPRHRHIIGTGLHLAMPMGMEAQVRPRSGMARDWGVVAILGTIDSDYRGELKVLLVNTGTLPVTIEPGDRIAQLVFNLVPYVGPFDAPDINSWTSFSNHELVKISTIEELGETTRGANGFGSTGQS